jgi:hypothetical protein
MHKPNPSRMPMMPLPRQSRPVKRAKDLRRGIMPVPQRDKILKPNPVRTIMPIKY